MKHLITLFTLIFFTGIFSIIQANDNPVNADLVISHSERISEVRIYSITGQLLVNRNFNDQEIRLDASVLKNGIYIVSVRDAQNKMFSKKLYL